MSRNLDRGDLYDYQRWCIDLLKEKPGLILGLEMGAGKTVITLTAIKDMLDNFEIGRVLVIAPKRVALNVWPVEYREWAHTKDLSVVMATGEMSPDERENVFATPSEILVINKELLPELWAYCKNRRHWPYDAIVIDEASMLKGGKRKTGKGGDSRFGVLAKARSRAKRVIELTGTPAPNGLQDLWGLAYIIDGGERLGTSREAFLNRWFIRSRYSYKTEPQPFAFQQIMDRLEDIMVTVDTGAQLDLPPVRFNRVDVTLPAKAMREYKRFEKAMVSEEWDVEAITRGVLTNKLLQAANGSIYQEDRTVHKIHDAKLDALEEIIDGAGNEPVLVAYSYQFDLEAIRKRFPQAVVLSEDDKAVEKWNAGKIRILLAHPASAGHGLNLQFGGRIAVWYGLNWSLELYQQFNKRLHRKGQKGTVIIHQIVAPGTIDESVLSALSRKGATQDAVTDAVTVKLERTPSRSN